MYSASEAFHNAVANGAHQIALLIFDDAVFTNDDINVSRGIEFSDYFNTEEDISIGQALSNQIDFNLFNDEGLLNDYTFGDFTATIGAQTGNEEIVSTVPEYTANDEYEMIKEPDDCIVTESSRASFSVVATGVTAYRWQYSTDGSTYSNCSSTYSGYTSANMSVAYSSTRYTYTFRCRMNTAGGYKYSRPVRMVFDGETRHTEYGGNNFTSYARAPFMRMNKSFTTIAPGQAVKSMLAYNGVLYCLMEDDTVKTYNAGTGAAISTITVNDFMKSQFAKWYSKGIAFGQDGGSGNNILRIWQGTNKRTYEFVPLGVFVAERPNVPSVNEIRFSCYDRMQKFEKDMPGDADLKTAYEAKYSGDSYTYPLTIMKLLKAMCAYVNVPLNDTTASSFINSSATISARPEAFNNTTMREVVQWISEAAASVARFDRDGKLKMDWLRSTALEIDEHGYSEFNPYWYETRAVTKLYNRASNGEYNHAIGSGDEGYLIQDNPLLKGVSS